MRTILDAEYRPPRRTIAEIFTSWFVISTLAFIIIDWVQNKYGLTDYFSRYISTIAISLIVAIVIFFIKMNEAAK